MKAPSFRLKLIGEEQELHRIKGILDNNSLSYSVFDEFEKACKHQESDVAEVFLVTPTFYFQSHINQLQKLTPQPEVILLAEEKIPNLAKILSPHMIFGDADESEILWGLYKANESLRLKKRLEALRDHHKRSWNQDSNPAIKLVTNLMKKCTIAEDYHHLLNAILTLKSDIEFQDCAMVVFDDDNKIINGWACTKEGKEQFSPLNLENKKLQMKLLQEEGSVEMFTNSSQEKELLDSLTSHPWSSCIAISFSATKVPRKKGLAKTAAIFLFRRELVPFLERDSWLLELSHGPLALALEKVVMLKVIRKASLEWRSTFDGISEPLTVIDRNYKIVKANRAFAQLVDQDVKKLKGKRCFSLLSSRRTPCVGCPVGAEVNQPGGVRLQLGSRGKKDLLAWSYGIRTGLDAYHFQFYRNVSKETLLTSALIQSEKMAALGRLVGAVAHEINNPLAGILATSQILLQENQQSNNHALLEELEEIRSATWRSKKIIDDLLGFTSPEMKKTEATDVLDSVKMALTFSKAALKEIQVKVSCDDAIPPALVSSNSLQQVLFNLFTNAAQAMSAKGSLNILLKKQSDEILISVKDTGPGFPPEKLKHIFDPFYTSKMEGMGTGLGLSIVKNLIQKMGAKIQVSSSSGQGTEFQILLPQVKSLA